MSNDIQELMKKPASELSSEEHRRIADHLEQQEEEERQKELDQIHKEQQKVKKRVETLETQLKEKKQELRELETQAASLAHKPSLRSITTLKEDSMTDMITIALYEADAPMGVAEVYEQVEAQMKKHKKGGKNPKQAVGSTLASSGRFEAVERGIYILTDQAAEMVERALEE
jgi:predicted nuclease with TOPRIM domain